MATEIKEELGDAIKQFNRGLDSHIEGRLDKALQNFKAALPTFQEFGVEDMIAGTFHEIGMVLQEQGEYDAALNNYQKSLHLCERIKYHQGCAKTLHQIGTLYEAKGDIITANEYYRKSKAFATKRPGGLNFIIVAFIISGIWGIVMGLGGMSGVLGDFSPFFIPAATWERLVSFAEGAATLLIVFGIIALISGIGLVRLKGWGWVAGIITSLLTVIMISGIIFYWYLSKEEIQELYDVK